MRKVKLIFFKLSGKYYTEEVGEYPKEWSVNDILDNIEAKEHRYKGMHLVLQFANDDEIGYPCMIPAERR